MVLVVGSLTERIVIHQVPIPAVRNMDTVGVLMNIASVMNVLTFAMMVSSANVRLVVTHKRPTLRMGIRRTLRMGIFGSPSPLHGDAQSCHSS